MTRKKFQSEYYDFYLEGEFNKIKTYHDSFPLDFKGSSDGLSKICILRGRVTILMVAVLMMKILRVKILRVKI